MHTHPRSADWSTCIMPYSTLLNASPQDSCVLPLVHGSRTSGASACPRRDACGRTRGLHGGTGAPSTCGWRVIAATAVHAPLLRTL